MKIILAILSILLVTRGFALQGMVKQYAQVNRPAYFRSVPMMILVMASVALTYFFSTISFGLEWYWSLPIAIVSLFVLPLIWGIIEECITHANYTFVGGRPAHIILIRIFLGLLLSIISVML